uniref:Uncharacterized protein n=1 Tax=Hemiselmis andersenii TaxID=464988 RepID=A0A6U4M9I4_HEMAN|mmetsp:Transcript_36523/g.85718  ORF Transcript_36523/g.85718 Transcript_36523/m.85718 type:complete len:222 (-) Transcript_36523:320-985(-)
MQRYATRLLRGQVCGKHAGCSQAGEPRQHRDHASVPPKGSQEVLLPHCTTEIPRGRDADAPLTHMPHTAQQKLESLQVNPPPFFPAQSFKRFFGDMTSRSASHRDPSVHDMDMDGSPAERRGSVGGGSLLWSIRGSESGSASVNNREGAASSGMIPSNSCVSFLSFASSLDSSTFWGGVDGEGELNSLLKKRIPSVVDFQSFGENNYWRPSFTWLDTKGNS